MTITRVFPVAAAALFLLGGCSQQESEPAAPEEPATVAEPAAAEQPAALPKSPSPDGARVFFITPADGDTVSNPISVEFGIDGMTVAPAGQNEEKSGHHHLLIDTDLPAVDMPIPADSHHIHFGDASTSTELTLAPGEHTLQLLLADYAHIPHDPPVMSDRITITVE